jgi:hypothetical protein
MYSVIKIMLKLQYETVIEIFCIQTSCNSDITSRLVNPIQYIAALCLHREGALCTDLIALLIFCEEYI